jgi:hypothetical protein
VNVLLLVLPIAAVLVSTPAHADDAQRYLAVAAGVGVGTVESDRFAPSRGHLRVEGGGHLDSTSALSLSSRLGFPPAGDLGHAMGVPSGMVRIHRVWTTGLRVHAGVGLGFFGHRVVEGTTDARLTGPLLVGAGTGYAVRIGASVRLVVELDAVAAIAPVHDIAGIQVEHGLHIEVDVGLALVR